MVIIEKCTVARVSALLVKTELLVKGPCASRRDLDRPFFFFDFIFCQNSRIQPLKAKPKQPKTHLVDVFVGFDQVDAELPQRCRRGVPEMRWYPGLHRPDVGR